MRLAELRRQALYGSRSYRGGESESDSSTQTTSNTTNQTSYADKRNVASEGAVSVSGDHNTISNTSTDFGSVGAALKGMGDISSKALDLSGVSISGALDSLKQQAAANASSLDKMLAFAGGNVDKMQDAFKTAQEEINGNRVLVLVGMVAVGMIAFKKVG